MEGAMAASSGALGGCSCLEVGRNKELTCRRRVDVCRSSFSDRSHLQYYGGFTYCGKKNKLERRKLKHQSDGILSDKKKISLLDGLSKNLSALSDSLTRSNSASAVDDAPLADQVRGRILSDALEVVMTQLAQVKAERKEKKRRLKAEKKALKARRDDSSLSSSSDSTDSECDVVDASRLSRSSEQQKAVTENYSQSDSPPSIRAPAILTENLPKGVGGDQGLHLEFARTAARLEAREADPAIASRSSGQIQVCTGPKCKRMGSEQLLAAFEGRIGQNSGLAVEAMGCKCMGKCRNAPNVRVRQHNDDDDLEWSQIHLGVGLRDVDSIVSHHFGEQVLQAPCRASVPA